jgi:biotin operon repressor
LRRGRYRRLTLGPTTSGRLDDQDLPRENRWMLFKNDVLAGIAKADVTLAFRRWQKPTVRAGGTLRTAAGVLAIDAIAVVDMNDLTNEHAARSGHSSLDALLADINGQRTGTLYRIAFHLEGADPRVVLRDITDFGPDERSELRRRLTAFDGDIPWTLQTLRLIAARDGITAGELAASIGFEKAALKQKIRKLKELGLTESLQSGYRISPRGRAFLAEI